MTLSTEARELLERGGQKGEEAMSEAKTIDPYPEHTKLRAVKDRSQCVGEFIEWLDEQGIFLAEYWGGRDRTLYRAHESRDSLLARFFEIDRDRLEEEKRAMLEECRRPR